MARPQQDGSVATGNSADNSTILTKTVSHTINSGLTDSLLLVLVSNATGTTPTSATWNGVDMTRFPWTSHSSFGAAFVLQNPIDGAHNVVVTWDIVSSRVAVTCLTFSGTKGPIFIDATINSFGHTAGITLATRSEESVAVDMCYTDTTSHTQGTGQTVESSFTTGATPSIFRCSTSIKDGAAVGTSTVMSVGLGTDVDWQIYTLFLTSTTIHSTPQMLVM